MSRRRSDVLSARRVSPFPAIHVPGSAGSSRPRHLPRLLTVPVVLMHRMNRHNAVCQSCCDHSLASTAGLTQCQGGCTDACPMTAAQPGSHAMKRRSIAMAMISSDWTTLSMCVDWGRCSSRSLRSPQCCRVTSCMESSPVVNTVFTCSLSAR